jgi:hypothetical protein
LWEGARGVDCGNGSAKPRIVTRAKEFEEQLAFLVKSGTNDRIEAARGAMSKAEFLRGAIDAAIAKASRQERP